MEKCDVCKKEKVQNQFYNRISGICKECVQDEFIEIVKNNGGRIKKPLFELCKKYNLPYVEQILETIKRDLKTDRKWEGKQARFIVSTYMKDITTLRQYAGIGFSEGESEVFADFVIEIEEDIETEVNLTKIDFLEFERLELQDKLAQSLKRNDVNTYKNLIQAYERILSLQKDEERTAKWTQMYSKYETKEKDSKISIPMISVWEQKGDEVRNTRVFEIAREVEYKEYELYFDLSCNSEGKDTCDIFFDKKVYKVIGDMNIIVRYIIDLIDGRNVVVYGDSRAFGMSLLDNLEAKNIKVKRENSTIYRPLVY